LLPRTILLGDPEKPGANARCDIATPMSLRHSVAIEGNEN
jgi:hypothetical protein